MVSLYTPGTPAYRAEIDQVARLLEKQFALPVGILSRMIQKESQYDPDAINAATGAVGILQQRPIFVDDQAQRFNNAYNPYNAKAAMYAAASYLSYINRKVGGNAWDLALIAYNFGEGNMRAYQTARAKGAPTRLPRETVQYIAAIAPEYARG